MKRNNTEQIGDVLRQFLRQQGLETPLNEYRLVDAWKDVVGPVITRYTTNLFIKNQVLYVFVGHPAGADDGAGDADSQSERAGRVAGHREHCVPLNTQPCSVQTSCMERSVGSVGMCGQSWK